MTNKYGVDYSFLRHDELDFDVTEEEIEDWKAIQEQNTKSGTLTFKTSDRDYVKSIEPHTILEVVVKDGLRSLEAAEDQSKEVPPFSCIVDYYDTSFVLHACYFFDDLYRLLGRSMETIVHLEKRVGRTTRIGQEILDLLDEAKHSCPTTDEEIYVSVGNS